VKVVALNKQSGGLFVASESLSGSESQLVCKAKPKQTGILSSRPRGTTKVVPFLFILVFSLLQWGIYSAMAEFLDYQQSDLILLKTLKNYSGSSIIDTNKYRGACNCRLRGSM
jgi:hypothetical protein